MGLLPSDPKPTSISLEDAYRSVRDWYTANIPLLRERMGDRPDAQKSEGLIRALPTADTLSVLEIRAVLGEVIYGNLEWAYHESDGQFKMAAYSHAALEQAGYDWSLSESERDQLRSSSLWPYLIISRDSE